MSWSYPSLFYFAKLNTSEPNITALLCVTKASRRPSEHRQDTRGAGAFWGRLLTSPKGTFSAQVECQGPRRHVRAWRAGTRMGWTHGIKQCIQILRRLHVDSTVPPNMKTSADGIFGVDVKALQLLQFVFISKNQRRCKETEKKSRRRKCLFFNVTCYNATNQIKSSCVISTSALGMSLTCCLNSGNM